MVLSLIPDSGKSGMGVGMDPHPRQIGDATPIPIPGQIGDGAGDGDRGFRALGPGESHRGSSRCLPVSTNLKVEPLALGRI